MNYLQNDYHEQSGKTLEKMPTMKKEQEMEYSRGVDLQYLGVYEYFCSFLQWKRKTRIVDTMLLIKKR